MIIPSWSLEPGLPDGLAPMKIDSVPTEIFSSQSRCSSHYGAHIISGMLFHYCCRPWLHPTQGSASLPASRYFLVHPIPSCSPNLLCSQSVHPPPQSSVLHILWSSQVYCQAWEVLSGHHCAPWATVCGPCLLHPCQVFLPILFMTLPRLWWIQHTYLAHLLADDIHECFSAYIPSLEHW